MLKRMREDIRSVFGRDPAVRNAWEVLTCYPGLHAVWGHRLSHWLWHHGMRWLARWLAHWMRGFTGVEIHPGARIGRRLFIDHGMGVVIGETAEIGDDCTLYQGVTLGGVSWNPGKRHPTLGNRVIVGAGAKVLGPFTVGDDARVGSNSVVTKEVPPGTTVVGMPARAVSGRSTITADAPNALFEAYGLAGGDMPDPVANAITILLRRIEQLDASVVELSRQLHRVDARVPELVGDPQAEVPELCEASGKLTAAKR
jgi:serine O-acetyltransferase